MKKAPKTCRGCGRFLKAPKQHVHDVGTFPKGGAIVTKNSKPAGVTCRPAGKEGRSFYYGTCVHKGQTPGTDAATHEPGHNYRPYYTKTCRKKQEASQK